MHVSGEPDGVPNAGPLDEGEQVGKFEFTAAWRTVDSLRDCLDAPSAHKVLIHDQAERLIRRNHLPGRPRAMQLVLEPRHLLRSKEIGRGPISLLSPLTVRAAVAAHVEHEYVEQRPVGNLAINAPLLAPGRADRNVFVKGAAGASHQPGRI